jgi:hypothetical protein
MASLRERDFKAALEHARTCQQLDATHRPRQPTALLVEALAHHGLGDDGSARDAIARSNKTMLGNATDLERANPNTWWADLLVYRLLLREAEAAVGPAELLPPPRGS